MFWLLHLLIGTSRRFLVESAVLCYHVLSGIDSFTYFLARVDSIEPALRRSGRFDAEVEVSTPNENERIQILKVLYVNSVRTYLKVVLFKFLQFIYPPIFSTTITNCIKMVI